MAVAVAVGPLVAAAARDAVDDRVVAGRRAAGVPRRPIARDRDTAGRGDRETERVPEPIRVDGVTERIAWGGPAARRVSQQLPAHIALVLRAARRVLVAQRDIEHAV